jgi:hypothetical protein
MRCLYSVGTWDTEKQAYSPQAGMKTCINITRDVLRIRIRALRCMGYTCHRRGNVRDGHDDNDTMVLIERTDGAAEATILEGWKR